MLDRYATALIQPAVDGLARAIARTGIKADHITLLAFALGLVAAISIAAHAYLLGAAFILLSRLCDALDGAVARQTQVTDAGGYLDITLDMLFYASIPLAFAIANPQVNALPAAALLAAFIGTGSSFLAFAALAAKRGITQKGVQGEANLPLKSLYFLGGLTEATETLGFFIAMCLWPAYFVQLSLLFVALCCVTIATRIVGGWRRLQ
jgi:phosphatidylglycerophosphate synthase